MSLLGATAGACRFVHLAWRRWATTAASAPSLNNNNNNSNNSNSNSNNNKGTDSSSSSSSSNNTSIHRHPFTVAELVETRGLAPNTTAEQLGLHLYPRVITPQEEASLLAELEKPLKRNRYDSAHWDNAIVNYREMHKSKWSEANTAILDKMRQLPAIKHMNLGATHVLDLAAEGEILPHVDSVSYVSECV